MIQEQENGREEAEAPASDPQATSEAEAGLDAEHSKAEQSQSEQQSEPSQSAEHAPEGDTEENLLERIQRLEEDKLRLAAETQNAMRRADQEVERARKFALESFTKDLVPVVDNLERALQAGLDAEVSKALLEGVELTLKSFQETLARYQLVAIDPEGEPFNPEQHQAMAMQENGDVEPNTVLTVFQKGYQLNGRLIRPAMVVVSKSPS